MRFGAFVHFNMNTFSGTWGCARQDPKKFNPTQLNCRQWVSAFKAAKMKFAILTAKHHDGFVLWPSKMASPNGEVPYTIAQSSVPTRDVVSDFTIACRDSGIVPCIFYSVHDVANGISGSGASTWKRDSSFILGQITELLSNYGPLGVFCTDGYGWYMGHFIEPFMSIRDTMRKLQPNCLYFDHCSVTSPWEEDLVYYEEPKGGIYCPANNIYASLQAITILSGSASDGPMWFYGNPNRPGPNPPTYVTDSEILVHLQTLEPRWCNFVINCPPDSFGTLDDSMVNKLHRIGSAWSPNTLRTPLQTQPHNILYPVHPDTAFATSTSSGYDRFGQNYSPMWAIDGRTDADNSGTGQVDNSQRLWRSDTTKQLPQSVTMDLGRVYYNLDIFGNLPRQDLDDFTGRITSFTIQFSTDNVTYTQVASGTWSGTDRTYHIVNFPPANARYVRLIADAAATKSGASGANNATVSEMDVGRDSSAPSLTPVSVKPTQGVLRSLSSPDRAVFSASGEAFALPQQFAGKKKVVEICDLAGRCLQQITTERQYLDIRRDFGRASGSYVVKVRLVTGAGK
jgi:alpha-L-fucosidase